VTAMSKPTAAKAIAIFAQMIDLLGFDAFMHRGWTQFYSGPDNEILKELFGRNPRRLASITDKKSNYIRSARQLDSLKHKGLQVVRLDDTKIGKIIEAMKIYPFFIQNYFPDVQAGINEADAVMRFLSRAYTRAAFGHVATAVCGASEDRVFITTELPELMSSTKIETINGIAHHVFNKLYESTPHAPHIGQYKAFRLICLSELKMAKKRAFDEATDEAIDDFLDRKDFYQSARRRFLVVSGQPNVPAIYKLSAKERKLRRALFKMSIWGATPTAPVIARPIRAPKLVR
jgi:hypothetical protein